MSETEDTERRKEKYGLRISHIGIVCGILSSLFYSADKIFAKALTIPPLQIALCRSFLQYCMLLPFALGKNTRNVDKIIGPGNFRLLLWLRGITGALSAMLMYFSVKYLSAGNTATLSFLNVVFIPILGRLLCSEALAILDICCAFLAICGVMMISKPPFLFPHLQPDGSENSAIGVLYGTVSALLASIAQLIIRKIGNRVSFWHSIFPHTTVGAIMNFFLTLIFGDFEYFCLSDVLFVVLMSVSAFLGQIFLTIALQNEKAGKVAVLLTLQIVIVYAIQVLVLHDIPSTLSLIGSGLIFSATVFVGIRKIVKERRAQDVLDRD